MNSTTSGNNLYTYHIITNAEFTGVLDKFKVYGYIGDRRTPENFTQCVSSMYDYHLFIKYGDKVYMDVRGVGDIVILFTELQKNKYWKYYYDLSLMLTNEPNLVIEDLEYSSHYSDNFIYNEQRTWSINTAYIDGSYDAKTKKVVPNEYNCYYRINPYNLKNMKCVSQKDLNIFLNMYMARYEIRSNTFEKKSIYYCTFVIDYCASLIEMELDELSVIFEDKKNIINLITLNDIHDMNSDILMIIYNNLISADGDKKYKHIVAEIEKYKRLENIAQILSV